MSISEEQLETLGDEELCLFNNRVRRVYDRRMSKKHGTKSGCFECGDPGHFVADCPKRNHYYLKGGGSGSNDAGGYTKPTTTSTGGRRVLRPSTSGRSLGTTERRTSV